ncbi:ATP synthase subunit delta [Lentibacillus sp. JNUCC-1]|uniref:F0F1 ATP synthase subunit delta n=1 Tax=Lentibacillus sp. JNUCC-1 TaxID=2654513 RepID=UPI0012E8903B|nr:F0F1 ATP synthase subunit delta [Lentibacillus sp. JNUCC-1]MUV37385.1 ATP synthase subunit delta [Lentibacillus sp. JNUCC-1]
MSEVVVAKRYADALYQSGNEKGTIDELVEEFRTLKTVFENNQQLVPFLSHPRLSMDDKKAFVAKTFNSCSVLVVNTLKLLVERHRINLLPAIVDEFVDRVNESRGLGEATIYSVRELSSEELSNLEKSVAKRFGKQSVIFTPVVDPSILGGIKIRMGNTIIDGTISSKLERIERSMKLANN